MNQRHKDLLALLLDLPDRFLHLRVAAGVALLLDPLEDPLGRMPLLPGNTTVVFQDLPDAVQKRSYLRLAEGNLSPITGRFTVLQDLLQRLPVHPRLAENLALTDLLDQNATTNLCPLFHVCVHPPTSESYASQSEVARIPLRSPSLPIILP